MHLRETIGKRIRVPTFLREINTPPRLEAHRLPSCASWRAGPQRGSTGWLGAVQPRRGWSIEAVPDPSAAVASRQEAECDLGQGEARALCEDTKDAPCQRGEKRHEQERASI